MLFRSNDTAYEMDYCDWSSDVCSSDLSEQDITLDIDTEAKDLLGRRGYDHTYGARPLRRIIQNLIEDPLAEGLLTGRFMAGHTVRITVEDDMLKIEEDARELAAV